MMITKNIKEKLEKKRGKENGKKRKIGREERGMREKAKSITNNLLNSKFIKNKNKNPYIYISKR